MAPRSRARATAPTTGKRGAKSQNGAQATSNGAANKKRKGNRVVPIHNEDEGNDDAGDWSSVDGSDDEVIGEDDDDNDDEGSEMDEDEDHNGSEIDESDMNSEEERADPGSICDVKNLYKTQVDSDGEYTWTTKYPDNVHKAAEGKKTAKYALIVRNIKSPDSRRTLEAASISIQSPWLKKQLGEIFGRYPGVNCDLRDLEFKAPFKPFIHRWNDFYYACTKKKMDKTSKQHMNLLKKVLDEEIGDKLKAMDDYYDNDVITFDDLWMVFEPLSNVFSTSWDSLCAYEVMSTEYSETPFGRNFDVKCAYIACDGTKYGRVYHDLHIPEFHGTKPINSLRVFPLGFHKEQVAAEKSLMARGKRYESLSGYHYKFYTGKCVNWNSLNEPYPIHVTSRVVVDPKSFNQERTDQEVCLEELTARDLEKLREANGGNDINPDGMDYKLSTYHHMICTDRTYGYCLKLKAWVSFFVDQISEIDWDEDAFDKLVLPQDQKELVMAFCESQLADSAFDDVITGKGKGVICLLSGPPGVGKTLTAEAVADHLRVPLHSLSSGSLGTDVGSVEEALESALELARRWKAILLLDECDVFLEARSPNDLERNGIVCAFLRALEYYPGIMFMTTNRVGNIDSAFKSRIHVELPYEELSFESRKAVWRHLLHGSSEKTKDKKKKKTVEVKTNVTEDDISELAEVDLNGRQIKNTLKMASLLAAKDKAPLKRSHVDKILLIEGRRPQ